MDTLRKPFQGVCNIIRFNWHFYVMAIAFIIVTTAFAVLTGFPFKGITGILITLTITTLLISLLISWYIYDLYPLYAFNWINKDDAFMNIINIHSGLDETSQILRGKFTNATITIMDFYNPLTHTEVSIKRARKQYPPLPGTCSIQTTSINFPNGSADKIFLILAAHEIRNKQERILFFKELKRLLKPQGSIYIMEHLRNFENFIAYTIGVLHFHSYSTWRHTFLSAGLSIIKESNQTRFIKIFELKTDGTAG